MNATKHDFIQGNSFNHLDLDDESVQLVVTSPPYPMVKMWDLLWEPNGGNIQKALQENNGFLAYELMHQYLDKTWRELWRVLTPGGIVCINIGDATRSIDGKFQIYHNHSRINQSFQTLGFSALPSIIWRKQTNAPNKFMGSGMLPCGAYVTLEHEFILIFRKGEKRGFNKTEKEERARSAIFWEERNNWYSDLWTDILGAKQKDVSTNIRSRTASYPMELPFRLISMYSMYNDTVLDPFAGIGTTSLAAMASGRNSISIDVDPELVEHAIKAPRKRGVKSILNNRSSQRILDHNTYVNEKDMLFFRYRNSQIGVPVKTNQEKAMVLKHIKSIGKKDSSILVKYQNLKATQLSTIHP